MSSRLSLLKLFGIKSYVDSLFDPTCVPVGVTINKLHLAPNRNMPRFVSVFRNRRGLSTRKPYVFVMFFYPFSHWSHSFTDIRWDGSRASVGRAKWDLSVLSDLKTVRMPWCCRQRRRTSDTPFMKGRTTVDLNSCADSLLAVILVVFASFRTNEEG